MSGERILIIEDNPIVQRTLKDFLEYKQYVVVISGDGKDGVGKIEREKFDLVLLDLNLPGIKGTDVLKEIRGIRPDVPVIIITGYPSDDTMRETHKLGAYDYIQKNVEPDRMLRIIKKAIDEKKESAPEPVLREAKILVAIDDEAIRNEISSVLRNDNYTVSTASDDESAVEKMSTEIFHILITVPKLGGLRLVKSLRIHTPVNFQTIMLAESHSFMSSLFKDKNVTNERLSKPLDAKRLLALISELWEKHKHEM